MHPLVQLASRLRAPDLVRVVVRARPHLKGISGGLVAAREIDAEACKELDQDRRNYVSCRVPWFSTAIRKSLV